MAFIGLKYSQRIFIFRHGILCLAESDSFKQYDLGGAYRDLLQRFNLI